MHIYYTHFGINVLNASEAENIDPLKQVRITETTDKVRNLKNLCLHFSQAG